MTQVKQTILLLALLLNASSITTGPFNVCSSFQTQAVIITNAQVPFGTNFSLTYVDIPLQNAQGDSAFQSAVNFKQLTMPNVQSKILIELFIISQNATGIKLCIGGSQSGASIISIKAIYLIVPSQYNSFINVLYRTSWFNSSSAGFFSFGLSPINTFTTNISFSTTLSTGSYQIVGFINNIQIQTTANTNHILGLSLNVTMTNFTHYSMKITSISQDSILLRAYGVTTIAFQTPSLDYGIKITTLTLSDPTSVRDLSILTTKTFFGMYQFSFQNADFQFSIDILPNNTMVSTNSANMITFNVQIISFDVGQCCTNTPLIDTVNGYCTSVCPIRYFAGQNPSNISKSCQPCLYECFTCYNSTTCTSCNKITEFRQLNTTTNRCDPIFGYYDAGVAIAQPCSFPNCCGQTPFAYSQGSSCVVSCPSGFFDISNVCCNLGYWTILGHCTNVIGCAATAQVNGSVQCLFCRVADHFIFQNQTCICSQGYSLDSKTGKCLPICGDGLHFQQECDDKNTENGDGCSSTCKAQSYFVCQSNSSYIPTQCAYIDAISLSFNYANKTEGKNQAVFSFTFIAKHKHVKIDTTILVSSFSFTCEPRTKEVTMSTSSTEVLLLVDYEEDLEGKLANVTFGLNPKTVMSNTSLSTSFLMAGKKQKLIFLRPYPIFISLTIEVLALVALAVFLLASLAYKMIAVEMLHSFLLVYLLCIETKNPTQAFLVFKNLRVLALNFNAAGNYYSQGSALPYSYENQLKTKQIISIALAAALSFIIIRKIVRYCFMDDTGKLNIRHSNLLLSLKRLQWNFMFSVSIGYGYQAIIPNFVFAGSDQGSKQASICVIFLTVCFSLLFFGEFCAHSWNATTYCTTKHLKAKSYPSIYLCFWQSSMALMTLNIFYKNGWLEQASLTLFLFFFFWFICVRPYNSGLHNAGQGINLATDVLFLSWATGRKYSSAFLDEYNEVYISLILITLMSFSIIFSIIRIFYIIRLDCQSTHKQVSSNLKQKEEEIIKAQSNQIERAFALKNKYMVKQMLMNEELLDFNTVFRPANKSTKRKKKLMAPIRQRYKAQSSDEVDKNDVKGHKYHENYQTRLNK